MRCLTAILINQLTTIDFSRANWGVRGFRERHDAFLIRPERALTVYQIMHKSDNTPLSHLAELKKKQGSLRETAPAGRSMEELAEEQVQVLEQMVIIMVVLQELQIQVLVVEVVAIIHLVVLHLVVMVLLEK